MAEGGGGDTLGTGQDGDKWEPGLQTPSRHKDLSKKADGNRAVDEVFPLDSESHGMVLRSLNFLQHLKKDFPDVDICLHDCNTKVIFRGETNEVEGCKREIANFFSTLHTQTLEMTPLQTELLLKPETCEYINNLLRTNNILGVLNVQKQGKVLLISQQSEVKEATQKIMENIQEKVFPVKLFPHFSEMAYRKKGLNQAEIERVVTRKTYEDIHVAATRDVMLRIIKWIQDNDQNKPGASRNQQHSVDVQNHQPSQSLKRKEERLKVSELDLCLWNTLGISDGFKECTTVDREIVVETLEDDTRRVCEEIKRTLSKIKEDVEVCHLHEDCGVLLQHQETKDYITQELQKKNHQCYWKLGTDSHTVNIYARKKDEAVNARKTVCTMISVISLTAEVRQVKKVLQEKACKDVLQKYHGKAKIVSRTDDEVPLVATSDAADEILKVMRQCDSINTKASVYLEMPEGTCEYLAKQSKFTSSLREQYGVHLEPSEDRKKLKLTGLNENLSLVKSTLEEKVADIGNESLKMKVLPEVLEDEKKKKKFETVNNCYLSKKQERVIVNPSPSHTWLIKKSPYLMLVSENIAETNVYAVVCPVDANLKPIGAGQAILEYGGMSLREDLQQNGSPSPTTFNSKPEFQPYFSGETGNLHCSSVIYTEFPAGDVRGSGMSTSKSVVSSKIKKTLEVAESNEVFSLAIPLNFSDVTALPICMQAVADSLCNCVGTLKHLREIYLYCPDGELKNARQIFTQAFQNHLHASVDFSLLKKGREEGRSNSPIQLDILEGSLTDQKVNVLVNTTNQELDLDFGFVSKSILKIAGRGIQKECAVKYKDGINIGDVAVTSAGKFSDVQHIFHVVLPHWKPTGNFSLMVLELLITKCLIKADKLKMHNIAFPVLGTGKLMYPQHLVAKTMCDTVNKYGSNRNTNIKTVKFTVFDTDTLQVFQIFEEYNTFGCCETLEDNPPYSIIEARIPTPVTSVQMQVLPFYGCWWNVLALVEFVTFGQAQKDPQYEKLHHSSFTREWIMKDSQYYLLIRTLCDSDDNITKGIQTALKIASEERITSLGFVVVTLQDSFQKKELTCKDQAKMIKKAVLEVKEKNKYLQEIKILVKSTEDFGCFLACKESKIESQEHGKLAKFKRKVPSPLLEWLRTDTSKCPWKIVRYMQKSDSGFKVTVVADKKDITNVMKTFLSETGATGGYHGNQTYTGDGRRQDATGGYHGNQTYTGDGRGQGATGGYHGNQTHAGDGRRQDATGGYHGNQTHTEDGRRQDATGGYHGNQTHAGDGRGQGATGGYHGNQTHAGDGSRQDATGGYHEYHENTGQPKDMNKTGDNTLAIQSPVQESMQQEENKVLPVQSSDVFDTIEAVVNPGILQVRQLETTVAKHGAVKNGPNIVCNDLSSLQKVDKALHLNFCQNDIRVDDTKDHLSSSQDDFEHVPDIDIGMPEETFLALQYFCSGVGSLDQKSLHYRDGMLQISCNEGKDKKDIQMCIDSKLKHIEVMNKDEVSFTPAEEPKVKGTIEQINKAVDGVFCYQLEKDEHSMVHLMAQSYSQLQTAKHKISLGLGRIKQTETRRNRRFDSTPLQQNKGDSTPTNRHSFSQSFTTSRSPWTSQSTAGYGSVGPKDFTTPEGLLVRVYPGSILHLDVDCIVNAANGDLQHGGGVAYVISNAAGYEFERESRDYIARYGPLRVGKVCTTSAGNLKYKGVIHAVGPRWYDYREDEKLTCLDDLKIAVKNSLEEADFQQYKSIAIPAISSGIFGVPKELCTQQYYRAVKEYSRSRGHSTLTEIHFIDKDTQMCELIQKTFTKCFAGNAGSRSYGDDTGGRSNFSLSVRTPRNTTADSQRSRSVSVGGDGSSVDPESLSFTGKHKSVRPTTSTGQRFQHQIGNNLTVHIVHGNIVEREADAIVSPENVQCDNTGSIAREIARVAGKAYVDNDQSELRLNRRKLKLTEVRDTLAGHSHFKYVLHVVAPKWDVAAIADQSSYWQNLKKSYKNIFSKFDDKRLDITSLALPILGTGKVEKNAAPILSICNMIANICKMYAEKTESRKTLYFCNDDIVAVLTLRDVFEKQISKTSDGAEDDQKRQTSPDIEAGRDRGVSLEVTENCCICIDTMTRPKKLSCGHVFCTECIDKQFKYKPACPQCGAVHGKITGDQPPGTMTMTTTKSYWGGGGSLPGYDGCGIINISYHFPSGKQGPDHPNPGKHYQSITRPGFLPDNEKGRLVAKLLRIAFDRKLVFTIGSSRTTGQDGVVTWNDIHHKTRMNGGPQAFGYPDPTYLDRVLDELKAKGVTEESLSDP